ncbi:hypothetical protein K443DRAFT_11713 [Laccaria amethystina LaAM-08-1]|uniref:Uncharacterized protein n=1 Tax=Laccaria amethystina LaAM-08-1 TaxID=1095629 RepID=A0A0C9XFT0_9AGAR|nr:hypothetical protein K443DRAFT_11713 [Laccaria amethystina LaAM-08-1]
MPMSARRRRRNTPTPSSSPISTVAAIAASIRALPCTGAGEEVEGFHGGREMTLRCACGMLECDWASGLLEVVVEVEAGEVEVGGEVAENEVVDKAAENEVVLDAVEIGEGHGEVLAARELEKKAGLVLQQWQTQIGLRLKAFGGAPAIPAPIHTTPEELMTVVGSIPALDSELIVIVVHLLTISSIKRGMSLQSFA